MPETNFSHESDSLQVADQVSNAANKATEKAQELGRTMVGKLEENRVAAAGALHNAASTLDDKADRLPNGPEMAHSAADKVHAVANYMERHDTKQMMADMEDVVKRNPGPALLVAAAMGFLFARAFSRD